MITPGDFKTGITIEYENSVYTIIDFQHVKPGKGAAFVRTKLKNVKGKGVIERSFNPANDKFPAARIDRKDMMFSYVDEPFYVFMDNETFEEVRVPIEDIKDAMKFVKDSANVKVCSHNGEVFSVEPPKSVDLVITETEPGLAGNTATNTLKPATVETGAQVNVPLFCNIGDMISIDTETGKYTGRAKA